MIFWIIINVSSIIRFFFALFLNNFSLVELQYKIKISCNSMMEGIIKKTIINNFLFQNIQKFGAKIPSNWWKFDTRVVTQARIENYSFNH